MRFKKTLISVLIATSVLTHTLPARAACCGDGATVVAFMTPFYVAWSGMFSSLVAGMGGVLTMMYLLHEDLAGVGGRIEGAMKVGAAAQADIMNQQKNLLVMAMIANEKARVVSEQSLKTLPGVSGTSQSVTVVGKAIAGAAQTTNYANISLAKRHMETKTGTGASLDAYQRFANGSYKPEGGMPNADILADTLLFGAANRGKGESFTFTPAQVQAAQDYIANAIEVNPPSDISDAAAKTVEGRRYRMLLRAEKARMGLPFKSFADALAYRTPIDSMPGKISYNELLTQEVRRRYNNEQWIVEVAGATPANLQREGLYMQALELHLRLEEKKHLEKIELLLAQLNTNQITGPMRQQLEAQAQRIGAK